MAYCVIADIRAEGYTEAAYPEYTDARVTNAIALAGALIDRYTSRWFESRTITLTVRGSGLSMLRLSIPPISITSVTIDGELLESTAYELWMAEFPDERHKPKLRYLNGVWPNNSKIEIAGDFGFVDDIFDSALTPPLIERTCIKVAIKALPLLVDIGSTSGEIVHERIGDYEYRLSAGVDPTELLDGETERILASFTKFKGRAV